MNRHALTRSPARLSNYRRNRSGMILAIVLVALIVVMLLGAALANAFLAQRQLARHNERHLQASWLADSALHRAAYRFGSEADYAGEQWLISTDLLNGADDGVAVIRVEAVADPQPGHRIYVDVTYPSNALKKTVQHRERFVTKNDEPIS